MSRKVLKAEHGKTLAIRVQRGAETLLLSVPPMHPQTPREIRVQVFELVLRRQYGLAEQVATDCTYDIENTKRRDRNRRRDELAYRREMKLRADRIAAEVARLAAVAEQEAA
jgi:hypothetical protein